MQEKIQVIGKNLEFFGVFGMPELKRVFLAINLPMDVGKKIFGTFSKKIPAKDCNVVESENLHVTLQFLGNLDCKSIEELRKKLAKFSEFEKFSAKIEKIGSFGNRILWIGISSSQKIEELAEKISKAVEIESDKFHAHITIARNKKLGKPEFEKLLNELGRENFSEKIEVSGFDLMESDLGQNRPVYSKIFSIKFGK